MRGSQVRFLPRSPSSLSSFLPLLASPLDKRRQILGKNETLFDELADGFSVLLNVLFAGRVTLSERKTRISALFTFFGGFCEWNVRAEERESPVRCADLRISQVPSCVCRERHLQFGK